MAIQKDDKDLEERRTRKHDENRVMHPGVAAAIGAVVGAAGGAAFAMASQNPEVRKKAKEQLDMLSKKANEAWNKINEQPAGKQLSSKAREKLEDLNDTAEDIIDTGKSESRRSKVYLK